MDRRLQVNVAVRISSYIMCYISSYCYIITHYNIIICVTMFSELHFNITLYLQKEEDIFMFIIFIVLNVFMYLCVALCFPDLRQHCTSVHLHMQDIAHHVICKNLQSILLRYTISLHVANCRLIASLLLFFLSLSFGTYESRKLLASFRPCEVQISSGQML
jgi:hypothetical protein